MQVDYEQVRNWSLRAPLLSATTDDPQFYASHRIGDAKASVCVTGSFDRLQLSECIEQLQSVLRSLGTVRGSRP